MGSAVKLGGGGGANGSADRTNSGIGIGGGSTLAGPDENTPLINGHSGSDGNGDDPGFWRQVLLDPRHTPGTDSSNHAVRYSAHVFNVTKATLLSSPVNILLVFVPLGIIAGVKEWSATAVFTLNFFAIIPLAAILSFATEEISSKLGETLGGLLNATFGNAVELIVSIVALRDGQIQVVQSSMLGSILSNLLLVMGMCFFLGGLWNNMRGDVGSEQSFASGTAQTTCSLMAVSSASMIIPAALYSMLDHADEHDKEASILLLSRGTSIILLLLYVLYLYFQLRTHKNLFNPDPETLAPQDDTEEEEEVHMSAWSAAAVLVAVTVVIAVCADYLVDSIDAIVATGKISKNFIGLILIPIVGNAAEHVTAVLVAVRNKMDLAMGVAVGSSIQIALLVTPFLVILGWIMGVPMTLQFETFETVAFFISVVVVTYTVQDGKSNYLEGAMLMGLYVIIALAFYASPSEALDKVLVFVGRSN
ncbi:putative calcium proton exchanger protein [Phaeoacremonium minimum UCRPA7]|uniref:Vacuolar calcium ion transporter n=1 Tax=Phaeoacremonium minimum (strain UCR-PA7) TaxID=1286976 RepID=R8BKH9_PHAM7|nr:putative calcium proton exchanger protein [Phaeoacremonium minimum UCRPA7]EON99863.1 putative calcium proton exchanger protein [Phaeoacremonium minimum UCRPA7]